MDASTYVGSSTTFLNTKSVRDNGLEGKVLTIKDVEGREFDDGRKLSLGFEEIEHGLTLNKTNLSILIDGFGSETDDWKGKKISLMLIKTKFSGQTVDGIQVKVVK